MTYKEVIETLNDNDIFDILVDLDADPIMEVNCIKCRTVCHHGANSGSHKLYYYFNNKSWICYTEHCKIGNIFNLIMRVKDCEFGEAYRYVCDKFNLKTNGEVEETLDLKIFDKYKKKDEKYEYKEVDKRALNVYYPFYHQSWLDDNITIEAMKKHNILFNIKDNRIIIPHYNMNGKLIGIRRRNLKQEEIDKGKYCPEVWNGKVYSHSLGNNIYGLENKTEEDYSKRILILFEAEKSVMQLEGYKLGLVGGALCGSNLTKGQYNIIIKLINKYDIREVVIGLDKEYLEDGDDLSVFYQEKIKVNMIDKLVPYVDVSVLWDNNNLLDYKDSPTDKGKEIFIEMMKNRVQFFN